MHSKLYRIIDVNLNRATEGLRVVEEICRFVLEDEALTLKIKKLRSSLSKFRNISERKALEDVGRELYTEDEGKREGLENVFRANMKRAQEAVRCLEEFSKLINPKFGKAFKKVRFELYDLEKRLAPRISKAVKLDFDLYVVTDPMQDHIKTIRKAVATGVKMVQFRDKFAGKPEYYRLAQKIVKITQKAGAVFILNDHWDLVGKVGADGVHLGQEDIKHLSLSKVRKEMGEDKIIGISTHSYDQAVKAEKLGADYISVGPIFKTPSKPNTKPVGLKLLRRVLERVKIPVVAIGGIDRSNLGRVRAINCQRTAFIRAANFL